MMRKRIGARPLMRGGHISVPNQEGQAQGDVPEEEKKEQKEENENININQHPQQQIQHHQAGSDAEKPQDEAANKKKVRCKKWPACKNEQCEYAHPTGTVT
jgi:hypothetical protein